METAEFMFSGDEIKLIQAYRKVVDKTQRAVMAFIESCAEDELLKRLEPAPALRIIAGGLATNQARQISEKPSFSLVVGVERGRIS